MAFQYNIEHKREKNRAYSCLLTTHTLNSITNLFVTTFLIAYIYSFNGDTYDYLFNVAIFNIAYYVGYALLYIPFSHIVEKTNRVIMYKIGIIVKTLLVVFFIFFGRELARLLVVAGLMNALGDAMYHSSFNVLRQEMVSKSKSSQFASVYYILAKIVEVVCPIILGALIDVITFSYTAIVVFAVCVVQIVVSSFVKSQKPEGSRFDLKEYLGILKQRPDVRKRIGYMYFISAIYGVSYLTTTLMNICIIFEYGSSFSLGLITGILSIGSIIVILLMNKFTKAGSRSWMFIVCSALPMLASIYFVVDINKISIIILNGIILFTAIIYKVLFDAHRNSTLKEVGLYDEIAEHHSIVEIFAGLSRGLCFALMLLISLFNSFVAFKIFVIVSIAMCAIIHLTLMIYERKYFRNSTKDSE